MSLTDEQIEVLLRPIKASRVSHAEGQSHVEAYDIRATLTRMFGFGNWDEVALEQTVMLYEQPTTTKAGKDAFKVAYRASRRLVIRDHDGNHLCLHDGSAVGEAIMPDFKRGDAHDMAIKTAESQALKRAAINLGDQFGLGLYNGGRTDAVVKAVVGFAVATEPASVALRRVPDDDHDEAPAVVPDTDSVVSQSMLDLDAPETGEDVPIPPDPGDRQVFKITDPQVRKLQTLFGVHGMKDRQGKLDYVAGVIGRAVSSSKEMTLDEAKLVIDTLDAE